MKFPRHEASLHLTHNEHKANYETVEQCYDNDRADWVSEEQRLKAIATQDVWELQWYPDTPVGFCCLVAADLDVLLEAAQEHDRDEEAQRREQGTA